MPSDERRIHARIETDLVCTVQTEDGPCAARIRDLSQGGALVEGPAGMVNVKDSIGLDVELPGRESPVSILGEVCRVAGDGQAARYGVRFSAVEPQVREDLIRFVERLAEGQGVGARRHPRVYRRVGVFCRTPAQTRVVMNNISRGGLALQCAVPLVLDEEVTVEVRVQKFPEPIELRGTVVHVRTVSEGQYQAGIRFPELPPDRAKALADLIQFLLRTAE